jgi:predicted Zn-dependent protease
LFPRRTRVRKAQGDENTQMERVWQEAISNVISDHYCPVNFAILSENGK